MGLEHDTIVDLVYDYLLRSKDFDLMKKFYKYNGCNEMDIVMITGLCEKKPCFHGYEVKSRDTKSAKKRAYKQLKRFEDYVRNKCFCDVRTYYVRPVRKDVVITRLKKKECLSDIIRDVIL